MISARMSLAVRRAASRRFILALALVAAVAALALAGSTQSAQAARPLTTGIIDEALFTSPDPQVRNEWLTRAKTAGAGLIRLTVPWRLVANSRPLLPTSPADPAYDMSAIDAQVEAADALGFQVLLTAYLAPSWAEGANPPADAPSGTWKPNAKAFGQFGQMLATRYSGLYNGLPRVRYFEAWNEPNLTVFLSPQWVGKTPYSPSYYRQMLNEFYAGVHRVQPGAKVLGGSTAPSGDNSPDHPFVPGKPRIHPLVFLRRMFCLADDLKPTSCPTKPKLDILSHHPVNIINAPDEPAKNPEDVQVADFHKLTTLLEAAETAGHVIPAGEDHPLWASEIWWLSDPPNPIGASLQTHARWIEQALYLLWKQGASTVIHYEIRDPAYDLGLPPRQQATAGLFLNDGVRKPAYTAWRFPFVGDRKSSSTVGIWGKAPVAGTLKVQRRGPNGWFTVKNLSVKRGQTFTSTLQLTGPSNLRGKIGNVLSLAWQQN